MRLIGSFEQNLDDKNRMRIPPKLRDELGDGKPVLTLGANRSLTILPSSKVDKILEAIAENPPQDEETMNEVRVYIANMYNIEEDSQGRFTLPKTYREYADIDKGLICNGMVTKIEVWSKSNEAAAGLIIDDNNVNPPTFKKLFKYGII